VPIARLNRNILQTLAESRLEEARILLANNQWTGAYYLTGLAVECALKACLARAVKEHDYPDKNFVNGMYQHNLQNLVALDAALLANLQTDMVLDSRLEANWKTVKDRNNEKRYDVINEQEAKGLYDAITETGSGVMLWIRGRW
jgi:AbiV family abortive infection protein